MKKSFGRIGGILVLACSFGAADAAPVPGCDKGSLRCYVAVTLPSDRTSGTCPAVNLDPPTVAVSKHERFKAYRIVWLLPPDYEFRPAMGDGVVIKTPDQDEFVSGAVSDQDNGNASGKPRGKRWRWKYLNTVDGHYDYSIQFRHKTDAADIRKCDPVISNIGAG